VDEIPIANVDGYLGSMQKSLMDKLFWVDKLPSVGLVVDFGCADGTVIKTARSLFPEQLYIGYDRDPSLLPRGPEFMSDWSKVQKEISKSQRLGQTTALTLLSVVHEVYTYGPAEVDKFWFDVYNCGFDYIAVRDMAVSRTASRPADPVTVARVRQLADPNQVRDWESTWGSLDENWSLVHYLLTYKYTDNWEREFRENYLPLTAEDYLRLVPRRYRPVYIEHFTPPFLRQQVEADFGIQLQERTHLKLILRKETDG
jgi:hypothetical protein